MSDVDKAVDSTLPVHMGPHLDRACFIVNYLLERIA